MKRIFALTAAAAGAAVLFTAPGASAAGVCVTADINVNGTSQSVNQCVPPAAR